MTTVKRDFSKTRELLLQFMNAVLDDLEQNYSQPEVITVNEVSNDDLSTGTMMNEDAARYLGTTERNLAVLRKYDLLKYAKCGKRFIYRKEWLDEFLDAWAGYDLSNEDNIKLAIKGKIWKEKHG